MSNLDCDNRNMPAKEKTTSSRRPSKLYLQAWLKKKDITAENLAERLNTSKSVISKLATGRQQYTQEWLERIAFAFDCEPVALLRDPENESAVEILEQLPPATIERAIKILKALS